MYGRVKLKSHGNGKTILEKLKPVYEKVPGLDVQRIVPTIGLNSACFLGIVSDHTQLDDLLLVVRS